MAISDELRAQILRYHFVEHWRVGTIASQLRVHHYTVERVLDETLTASVSGISDADGLDDASDAYQWFAHDGTDDSEIAGATGATHEVAAEDAGKTLKVRATFTDDKGNEETLVAAHRAQARARHRRGGPDGGASAAVD